MTYAIINKNTFERAQQIVADLNLRLQELVLDEMRGRRISHKMKRDLQAKRTEAHKMMRASMAK